MAQNPTVRAVAKADRISDLPCPVVDNILKCLPLKDAVRTSILSRGWRYKWTTIPYLVFDEDLIKSLSRNYECDPKSIISHVLAVHKGPIVKFELVNFRIDEYSTIDCWLHFLSKHHIEDLTLEIFPYHGYKKVLHHQFGFDHLRYLCLWQSKVKLPPFFKGFNRLLKLVLWRVDLELEGDFNMFISKCPMLEHLDVSECKTPLSLVIDAPNLKFFYFDGMFKSIIFRAVNIEEISVNGGVGAEEYDDYDDDFVMSEPVSLGTECNIVNVFGQLSSLKRLKCGGIFLEFLAVGVVPRKLPNAFNHLTRLDFPCSDLRNMDHVRCVLCLIRSCPNLQKFSLYSLSNRSEEHDVIRHLKAEQKLRLSRYLKKVKIYGFSGSKTHTEFVKLLLLGAMRLMKLKLYLEHPPHRNFLKELLVFPRASQEAAIIVRTL